MHLCIIDKRIVFLERSYRISKVSFMRIVKQAYKLGVFILSSLSEEFSNIT